METLSHYDISQITKMKRTS